MAKQEVLMQSMQRLLRITSRASQPMLSVMCLPSWLRMQVAEGGGRTEGDGSYGFVRNRSKRNGLHPEYWEQIKVGMDVLPGISAALDPVVEELFRSQRRGVSSAHGKEGCE